MRQISFGRCRVPRSDRCRILSRPAPPWLGARRQPSRGFRAPLRRLPRHRHRRLSPCRLTLGLIGVLIAVLVSGFNEHVIEVELDDIQGAMGFSHDQGTWVTAIYEATEISAMAFAPWCAITFSIRRFAIAMIALFAVIGAVAPYAPDLPLLYVLRAVQGFAGGTLPPLLMTVALRYLPPKIKIHGLGAYTLTATFGPNMGTPLGAWCFDYLGWHSVFWEVIPSLSGRATKCRWPGRSSRLFPCRLSLSG